MKEWKPTDYDLEWIRTLFQKLKVGGIWATSYGVYQKIAEDTVELIKINETMLKDLTGNPLFSGSINENLKRTKMAIEGCGLKYVSRYHI